ncbi:hypothetical protein [Methylocystis parvus]|uniref:hypothetical protein n=1 Tax=Methylocystis parvus TaxID=134 RepID=UPI003C7716D2
MSHLKAFRIASAAGAVALSFAFPGLAEAALSRAWVSSKGADGAGCGAPTSPCRQIKYVLDNNIVAPGGEIDVLDPAGFAPVTITMAVSIVNDGAGTASVQQGAAGGAAITINAGANDAVHLRGLSIDGVRTGHYGVLFNSGASLDIVNCRIGNFARTGVVVQPTAGTVKLAVLKSSASNNAQFGILVNPASAAVVKANFSQVVAQNNALIGIHVVGMNATSAPFGVDMTMYGSDASSNGNYGVMSVSDAVNRSTGMTRVVVSQTTANQNYAGGFGALGDGVGGGAVMFLDRSVSIGGVYGDWFQFYSTSTNYLKGNSADSFWNIFTASRQ